MPEYMPEHVLEPLRGYMAADTHLHHTNNGKAHLSVSIGNFNGESQGEYTTFQEDVCYHGSLE